MEPWSDTTFIPRSPETIAPDLSRLPEFREIGERLYQPRLTLVLSPGKLRGISVSKEGEPPKEESPYQALANEAHSLVAETLGLPEQIGSPVEVIVAHYADSDISVEFDCQPKKRILDSPGSARIGSQKTRTSSKYQ